MSKGQAAAQNIYEKSDAENGRVTVTARDLIENAEYIDPAKLFEQIAAEMMGQYDMSDVSVEAQGVFPHIKIKHPMTFEGTCPEGTKDGQFFSTNTAMTPCDELIMVVYQTKDQRICGSKTVKQNGPVYCRCLNQIDGVGYPYIKDGEKTIMGDEPRTCALCPHNTFHAMGKDVVLLPPLNDDAKCKSTKVWGGFLLADPKNITLATVMPITLGVGAGALSTIYRKEPGSWYKFADDMKMKASNPMPWHSAVLRVTTQKFKFEAGSTHLPMFEVIGGGPKVFTPMKAIVAEVGQQLMLSTGRDMDIKALAAESVVSEEYAPVMTGPQS